MKTIFTLGLALLLQSATASAQLSEKVSLYVASSQVHMGTPAFGLYVELNPNRSFRSLEAYHFANLTGCVGSYDLMENGVLLKIEGCGKVTYLKDGEEFEIKVSSSKPEHEIQQEILFSMVRFPFDKNQGQSDTVKITLKSSETQSQTLPGRVLKGEIFELEQEMYRLLNPFRD